MQESTLHNQIKNIYTLAGDQQEVWVDGYLVDVLRGDLIIEIQTQNFSAIKPKLKTLLDNHPILLVHPIPIEKWIIRQMGDQTTKRRSPRHGRLEDLFYELVRISDLITHPNFRLETPLIRVEEYRVNDGKGSWRRKGWSISDRRLTGIVETEIFSDPDDFRRFIPTTLTSPFSSRELCDQTGIRKNLGNKLIYCLCKMNVLVLVGKRTRARLYDYSR